MDTLPLTLLVMTYNEAENIGRCLDSVPLAAEKIVIDSGSTDDTCAIAARHGARVVHQDWLGFGPQRNFGSTVAAHDWILFLDADECLSPELLNALAARLPGLMKSDTAGAILRREAWYLGAPMRWYKPMVGEKIARLYHRGRARWTDARVHESLRFDGKVEQFDAPFRHFYNPTLVHEQLKMLKYAELKARDWLDRGRSPRLWEAPLVFLSTFFKDYILRRGFLDGARGYIVSHVAANYAVYKRLRYYEMRQNPDSLDLADTVLQKHGLQRGKGATGD
jgi:glycosyltransferase involved in cell wall biosynthesis